jgi:hypothetical protein
MKTLTYSMKRTMGTLALAVVAICPAQASVNEPAAAETVVAAQEISTGAAFGAVRGSQGFTWADETGSAAMAGVGAVYLLMKLRSRRRVR